MDTHSEPIIPSPEGCQASEGHLSLQLCALMGELLGRPAKAIQFYAYLWFPEVQFSCNFSLRKVPIATHYLVAFDVLQNYLPLGTVNLNWKATSLLLSLKP